MGHKGIYFINRLCLCPKDFVLEVRFVKFLYGLVIFTIDTFKSLSSPRFCGAKLWAKTPWCNHFTGSTTDFILRQASRKT